MQKRFEAPPERVFDTITNHAGMGEWLDGVTVALEKTGQPSPNGVGAVRRISARGLAIREEVVRFDRPTAMDYRVIGGAPLRDHLGEMRFRPEGSATVLDYRIRFRVPWYLGGALLGSVVARQLQGEITRGLDRLATRLR